MHTCFSHVALGIENACGVALWTAPGCTTHRCRSPALHRGGCPKLDSPGLGPCYVLERLGEVVYRVELPPRGPKVALHRDQLSLYKGSLVCWEPTGGAVTPTEQESAASPGNVIGRVLPACPELNITPGGGEPTQPGETTPPGQPRRRRRVLLYVLYIVGLCEFNLAVSVLMYYFSVWALSHPTCSTKVWPELQPAALQTSLTDRPLRRGQTLSNSLIDPMEGPKVT